MKFLRSVFCKVLLLVLSVAMIASVVVLNTRPTQASTAFSLSSSAVNNGNFTVTLSFPDVTWGGFEFILTYDKAKVQLTADPDMPSSKPMLFAAPSSNGNATGSVKIAGGGIQDITASGVVITMPFRVVDNNADSVTISLSVTKFILYNNTPVQYTAPSPLNITLKTPSSSTDGGGSGSTSTTDEPPVSTSTTTNTTTSTKTDTNTTTTKTDTNTTTKTNSTTKTSGTVVSSTTSDTGTEPDVTDSEELTDTETNFPLSDSNSDTDSQTDVTDNTDTTSDQSASSASTVTSSTQEAPKKEISTVMIALISVGISVVICGALTVVGLLRHKKEQE